MKSKFKKVALANIDDFNNFITENKKVKYLDVILGDLSGIIRGKEFQLLMQIKFLNLECSFVIQPFYSIRLAVVLMQRGRGFTDGDLMQIIFL